jgi:hypothetical protein
MKLSRGVILCDIPPRKNNKTSLGEFSWKSNLHIYGNLIFITFLQLKTTHQPNWSHMSVSLPPLTFTVHQPCWTHMSVSPTPDLLRLPHFASPTSSPPLRCRSAGDAPPRRHHRRCIWWVRGCCWWCAAWLHPCSNKCQIPPLCTHARASIWFCGSSSWSADCRLAVDLLIAWVV